MLSLARPSGLLQIHLRQQAFEQESGQRLRLLHSLFEGFFAFLAHQGVRVFAVRQKHEPQLAPVVQVRQRGFQRPPCRFAAGAVAVVTADDVVGGAEQQLNVFSRRRGSERGDGIIDAELRQRHHVHIPFHHQQPLQGRVVLLCFIQAVKLAALMENFGFRRVQVLRHAIAQYAAAEGDHAPAFVADGGTSPVRGNGRTNAPDR